ncbi:restriction endonuclease subunit S [Campylobacter concisus]|uniref:restriction endonuclease subunit S n=1 Tax=Campylobacter concisus TaxID=199 RepID=UPI0019012F3F|nr:restriction endonuclease subunit S [Campylobacter concisus]
MSSKYNLHYEKIGKETRFIKDEILFEIPSSWTWVRLGSMGATQTGSTPSTQVRDFYGDYMPFIKPADITNSGIDYNNEKLSKKGTEVGRVVEKGSILMVCIGGSLGKCYFNDRIVSFNQQINSLTPFFSSYKFIFYYLLSSYFFEQLQDKATGTATPIVNKTSWESILIPLPPLQEQKRIVDKLEEILPLVEKYKEDKEKLDELNLNFPSKLKKSILDYAIKGKLVEQNLEDESVEILLQKIIQEKQRLVKDKKLKADKFPQSTIFIGEDNSPYEKIGRETRCIEDEIPFEIPSSWTWVRLGEICQIYTGDSINQTQKLTKYTNLEDGRCYIATKDVGFDGSIDYENGVKIPFEESKFKIAPRNSVLLCVEGGSAGKKIGHLDCDVCFGNKLCCFNPLLIEPRFIYYYLQSQIFIDSFMQKMSGIISGISLNAIKTIVIALPPLQEQKRIVEKIELLLPLLKP